MKTSSYVNHIPVPSFRLILELGKRRVFTQGPGEEVELSRGDINAILKPVFAFIVELGPLALDPSNLDELAKLASAEARVVEQIASQVIAETAKIIFAEEPDRLPEER